MPEMEKVNAFDVIRKMSEEGNKKLRLAPLSNIIAADQNKKHCTMKVVVEAEDIKNYMLDKTKYGGLLLIDKDAFEETERKIREEIASHSAEIEKWKAKAEKWDKLGQQIAKYYPDNEDEESEEPGDLVDIGEVAARAFGWL